MTLLIGSIHTIRSGRSNVANPADMPLRSEPSPLRWEDFNKDCGFKSYLGNPIHVTVAFSDKYKSKTFRWRGKLHHVEEGFTLLWFSQRGAVFACMDPPQLTSKRVVPDLVLLYDDNAEKVAREAAKLKKDQLFDFEASMVEVGRRGAPHTMVLWDIFPVGTNGSSAGDGP